MKPAQCLIVPGVHGSGEAHWQTWAEQHLPNAVRLSGVDFDSPVIASWADAIRIAVKRHSGNSIIIAHSFGCLAAVASLADINQKVAAMVLVAPASPLRFDLQGFLPEIGDASQSVAQFLPKTALGVTGVLIGSSNDPWLKMTHASYLADTWGLAFACIRNAGHINAESGYGPWPALLQIIDRLREQTDGLPLGELPLSSEAGPQRYSTLVKIRQLTRQALA